MRPLLILVCMLLLVWLILPVDAIAEIRIDSNRIIIDTTFTAKYYGDPKNCSDGEYPVAWTGADVCNEPTETVVDVRDLTFPHFKLIDAGRTCLLMNIRPIGPNFNPGVKSLRMSFPIGDTITAQNIEFLSGSYFTSIQLYSPHDTRLIERNTDYIIELTAQFYSCDDRQNRLVEKVDIYQPVQIPCCVGARGDVNCDGVVADTLDINRLIDYLWYGGDPLCCPEAADVAPVNNPDGTVNLTDVTILVNYYNGIIDGLPGCSEPSWP